MTPLRTSRALPDWQLGWTADPGQIPGRFVPAVVPGAVQLDWASAEGWPAYWQAENFRDYGWMEDVHWIYQTRLAKPALAAGQCLVLVCGGVDYACTVRVDGRVIHEQEGMFSPFEIDLTNEADGSLIEIIVAFQGGGISPGAKFAPIAPILASFTPCACPTRNSPRPPRSIPSSPRFCMPPAMPACAPFSRLPPLPPSP